MPDEPIIVRDHFFEPERQRRVRDVSFWRCQKCQKLVRTYMRDRASPVLKISTAIAHEAEDCPGTPEQRLSAVEDGLKGAARAYLAAVEDKSGVANPEVHLEHLGQAAITWAREDRSGTPTSLEEACDIIRMLLSSARPHPVEHPTMDTAWEHARGFLDRNAKTHTPGRVGFEANERTRTDL